MSAFPYRLIERFFANVAVLTGGWTLALISSSYFADPESGDPDIIRGIRVISVVLAVVIVIFGVIPAVFVKERFVGTSVMSQSTEGLWNSLKQTFRLTPLWVLVGIIFFHFVGFGTVSILGQYVNIFYVNQGAIKDAAIIEGWKATSMFFAAMVSLPFWVWFCGRYDKKVALAVVLCSGIVNSLLNLVCMHPDYPYLQLIPAIFYAGVVNAIWMILTSMIPDIADYDELETGKRREGSINAVWSWFIKFAMTISAGLSGFLLQWTGFDVALGMKQPEEVTRSMLLLFSLLPIAFLLITLILLRLYPLNRETMGQVRQQLEARRGVL